MNGRDAMGINPILKDAYTMNHLNEWFLHEFRGRHGDYELALRDILNFMQEQEVREDESCFQSGWRTMLDLAQRD